MEARIDECPPVLRGVEELTPPPHSHHWYIAEPEGALSEGWCQCGAVRLFKNYDWAHDFVLTTEARLGC